jgi:protein arginine kinase activator
MRCDNCGERDAVIHLTQVVEGEARTVGLCEECAAEKGIQTPGTAAETPLGGFLSALWKDAEPAAELVPVGRCEGCGATFADFRESGRLGCGECWRTFEPALRVLLRRYHGSTRHLGRREAAGAAPDAKAGADLARDLREQLRVAVESENFELAAELRDRLKGLP